MFKIFNMNKRAMIDTNLLSYFYDVDKDDIKREFLVNYLKELRKAKWQLFISSQVCKELARVAYEKYNFSVSQVSKILKKVRKGFNIVQEDCQDLETALELKEKYNLQFWDAIILAVCLNNEIPFFLTEDLTYKEIKFGGKTVSLINPFSLSH